MYVYILLFLVLDLQLHAQVIDRHFNQQDLYRSIILCYMT